MAFWPPTDYQKNLIINTLLTAHQLYQICYRFDKKINWIVDMTKLADKGYFRLPIQLSVVISL